MSSSPSSMLYRRATTSQARSFMINDILQSHVYSLEKRKMELQNFRSACPVEYIDADFLSSANRRSFLSGIPNSDEVKLSRYPSSVNPYAKLGFNFIPPNAGYFLSRAAEIMASNCVYPTLPVPLPMPPYDHLPVHRFLHFADGGVGSRKCRRSRTVFSELQLMALEERFERQKYLSTPDRMELAEALGLTQLQVKTWYQNRRMKWKKQVQHSDESPSASSDTNSSEAKSKFSANQSADSPPVVSPGCETTCSSKDMDALKDQKPFTGSRKGYVSPQPASQLPRATFPGFPSFPVSRNPSLSYRRDVSYDYGISHCDSTFEN